MWISYATVIDSKGNTYTDMDFIDSFDEADGFDGNWQLINELMMNHTADLKPDYFGFGGDDQTGILVLAENKSIPDMKFTIKGTEYTMQFAEPVFEERSDCDEPCERCRHTRCQCE